MNYTKQVLFFWFYWQRNILSVCCVDFSLFDKFIKISYRRFGFNIVCEAFILKWYSVVFVCRETIKISTNPTTLIVLFLEDFFKICFKPLTQFNKDQNIMLPPCQCKHLNPNVHFKRLMQRIILIQLFRGWVILLS